MNMTENRFNRAPNKNLTDFCEKLCLQNQISQPTRVTNKTSFLIDML